VEGDKQKQRGRVLKEIDYVMWALCIVAVFLISMYAGSWGILRSPDLSPQTRIINAAYQITYLLAMSVFSVFAGTLIFFVIKFRARGEEVEL
jgi:heme/copper-type cytochrome/quinol oxidase subunit 2